MCRPDTTEGRNVALTTNCYAEDAQLDQHHIPTQPQYGALLSKHSLPFLLPRLRGTKQPQRCLFLLALVR